MNTIKYIYNVLSVSRMRLLELLWNQISYLAALARFLSRFSTFNPDCALSVCYCIIDVWSITYRAALRLQDVCLSLKLLLFTPCNGRKELGSFAVTRSKQRHYIQYEASPISVGADMFLFPQHLNLKLCLNLLRLPGMSQPDADKIFRQTQVSASTAAQFSNASEQRLLI